MQAGAALSVSPAPALHVGDRCEELPGLGGVDDDARVHDLRAGVPGEVPATGERVRADPARGARELDGSVQDGPTLVPRRRGHGATGDGLPEPEQQLRCGDLVSQIVDRSGRPVQPARDGAIRRGQLDPALRNWQQSGRQEPLSDLAVRGVVELPNEQRDGGGEVRDGALAGVRRCVACPQPVHVRRRDLQQRAGAALPSQRDRETTGDLERLPSPLSPQEVRPERFRETLGGVPLRVLAAVGLPADPVAATGRVPGDAPDAHPVRRRGHAARPRCSRRPSSQSIRSPRRTRR